MDIKIVKLTKENKQTYLDMVTVTSNFDYIDDFVNDDSTLLFFATDGKKIFGVSYGYVLTRMNSKPMLYVHSVDVHPDHRRKGIGSMMMNAFKEYAKEYDLLKMFLITNKSNEKAVGLYDKVNGNKPYDDDLVFEWKKEQL